MVFSALGLVILFSLLAAPAVLSVATLVRELRTDGLGHRLPPRSHVSELPPRWWPLTH